jgi:alpha/beta superfamily hydrolase
MTTRVERVWFEGSAGDHLAARLDLPIGEPTAFALFAHCFTCSKEAPAATHITRGLVNRGIGVLRFDFTGLGASKGDFGNTNFSSNVEDLVRAADMLRRCHAANEQRSRLVEMAQRCPVHRTLVGETEIITRLAGHP